MTAPSLWDRLRHARIVQVLAVYLGASWVVLQIADVLSGALSLPPWVLPVAVLLLLVGLVIIVATAWVQSQPATSAKEAAGELPTDWQVAPAEALASLRAGKLPHLTWGRSILGGVVALGLLFGGAGAYVLFAGSTPKLGPRGLVADVAAEGIAVIPFEVRGQGLEIWREGMVDLLANNLDGLGGFRTIDSRTVMARWQEAVGDVASADLDAALGVAGATGARYALLGSVVGLGENVRLVANVYDLDTRKEVAQGQAQGPVADVLRLVDDLAVGTIRSLLERTGGQGKGDLRAETLTTESLPALREFLEGERHFRKGAFAEAAQSYERAVAADTTFAIALVRLAESYGWMEAAGSEKMQENLARAEAHAGRLPPRYQFIMRGWTALTASSVEGLPILRQAVQKYPDDPEAWFLLAETLIHLPQPSLSSLAEIHDVIERAVALDPNFAPYRVHQADVAVMRGDRAGAEAALERYRGLGGNPASVGYLSIAIPLLLGDSAEAAGALAAARKAPAGDVDAVLGTFNGWVDDFDRFEPLQEVFADLSGINRDAWVVWSSVTRGALGTARELAERGTLSPVNLQIYLGHSAVSWGVLPEGELAGKASAAACATPFNGGCYAFAAAALATAARWPELAAAVRSVRQAAQEAAAAGDSTAARARLAAADVMEGVGEHARGNRAQARALLVPHRERAGLVGNVARQTLARIDLAEQRWEQAARQVQGEVHSYARASAFYIQAQAYEGRGDTARAREAWRHFVATTRTGDGDLPQIRTARAALARLGG